MKRILCLLLCAVLLGGCAASPGETTVPALPTVPVITDQETVAYPQTGEYRETALMANVPDQGTPLLLNVRSDGCVDYIYTELEERGQLQSFPEGRVRHYLLSPDGTAAKQDEGWMAQLDTYTAEVLAASNLENGRWRYLFAAEDGVILILAQFHDIVSAMTHGGNISNDGEIRHTALFKLENGVFSKIPMEYGDEKLDLEFVSSITLEQGQLELRSEASPYVLHRSLICRYGLDGTILDVQEVPLDQAAHGQYVLVDADGLLLYSAEPKQEPPEYLAYKSLYEIWGISVIPQEKIQTEDDSLYLLGRKLDNLEMTACGADGTFYCWFRELHNGVLMQYAPNPDGKIDPEVVTVWSLEQIDLIETAVAQWNSTHDSPIFRYETAQGDRDEVLTRLRLELANGQGPDVLIMDGFYTDGLLDFMVPLDRLDLTGVYENLHARFTLDGELRALPVRMEPYLLARTTEGTREIGSLTEFADVISESKALDLTYHSGQLDYDALYNIKNAGQLFELWYPAWSEAIWEDGRYHPEVFREFLTQLGRLTAHYNLDVPLWYRAGGEPESILNATDDPMYGNENGRRFPYVLAATDHVGLYAYWWYDDGVGLKPDPTLCTLAGIPGPDGIGAAVARVITGVRSGGNESAGLAFLQLLLTESMQLGAGYYDPADADGYPVKWSATEKLLMRMKGYMNQAFAAENDYQEVLSGLRVVAVDDLLSDTAYEIAMRHLRQEPNDWELANGMNWDTLTLEEAVEELGKVNALYLAEQSR